MATTAPIPLFAGGNIVQVTDIGITDDTNLFAVGNIFSILEFSLTVDGDGRLVLQLTNLFMLDLWG